MEFFEVKCSKCGESIQTTARTFPWPFFCDECEAAKVFAKDIAPIVNAAVDKVMSGPMPGMNPPNVQKSLDNLSDWAKESCTSATVENTTLLIEDLEAQVAASAKALDTANELINDLMDQSKKESEEITRLRFQLKNSKSFAVDLWTWLEQEMQRGNQEQKWRQELRVKLGRAQQDVAYWQDAADRNAKRSSSRLDELCRLEGRGFWARVFNQRSFGGQR